MFISVQAKQTSCSYNVVKCLVCTFYCFVFTAFRVFAELTDVFLGLVISCCIIYRVYNCTVYVLFYKV